MLFFFLVSRLKILFAQKVFLLGVENKRKYELLAIKIIL